MDVQATKDAGSGSRTPVSPLLLASWDHSWYGESSS
jgi:hypothetical protein